MTCFAIERKLEGRYVKEIRYEWGNAGKEAINCVPCLRERVLAGMRERSFDGEVNSSTFVVDACDYSAILGRMRKALMRACAPLQNWRARSDDGE